MMTEAEIDEAVALLARFVAVHPTIFQNTNEEVRRARELIASHQQPNRTAKLEAADETNWG